MRARRRIGWALVVVTAATAFTAIAAPTAALAEPRGCNAYRIFGVRSASESYDSTHIMGTTVGTAADHVAYGLTGRYVTASAIGDESVVYPAAAANWSVVDGNFPLTALGANPPGQVTKGRFWWQFDALAALPIVRAR
jgi:hypothetical protein